MNNKGYELDVKQPTSPFKFMILHGQESQIQNTFNPTTYKNEMIRKIIISKRET